eukprot:1188407-Prorocentrum_minimum.AAC.2
MWSGIYTTTPSPDNRTTTSPPPAGQGTPLARPFSRQTDITPCSLLRPLVRRLVLRRSSRAAGAPNTEAAYPEKGQPTPT